MYYICYIFLENTINRGVKEAPSLEVTDQKWTLITFWKQRLRLPWKAACPAQERGRFVWRRWEATRTSRVPLPSKCRHLRWAFHTLLPSSGTQVALLLMGDACKILCWVIAALFFKHVAAFSARCAAGEEPRCHCIPAHANSDSSCRGRDSQRVKSLRRAAFTMPASSSGKVAFSSFCSVSSQ